KRDRRKARALERQRPAQRPGPETDEGVDQGERDRERERLEDGAPSGDGGEGGEQPSHGDPGRKVEPDATSREDRMHRSVLDLDAAHDGQALEYQTLPTVGSHDLAR